MRAMPDQNTSVVCLVSGRPERILELRARVRLVFRKSYSYNFLGCPPPGVPPFFAFHRHTNKLLFSDYLLLIANY